MPSSSTSTGTLVNGLCKVTVVSADGTEQPLDPRFDLRNHSPDGFSWSYAGSGPSQLALALLADATGDDDLAQRLHIGYKHEVVAGISGDRFEMTQDEVRAKAAELEKARGRGL